VYDVVTNPPPYYGDDDKEDDKNNEANNFGDSPFPLVASPAIITIITCASPKRADREMGISISAV
jgi:hypothetical protein